MAKSPHTPEFRAKVSQEYLDGVGSYDFISAKYSIGSKTLRQWISWYLKHLIKQSLQILMQNLFFIVIEAFNIQAKYSKRN
ncbi:MULTISPECIES: helix-turn-helix domain-containing protein [Lacrimispora]|uniref:helix-turn-helix domain-containing protein n=1 Tax=Lacrimispora TaxID=2719231 RepID=UPI0037706264